MTANDIIVLNGTEEDMTEMRRKMDLRRSLAKQLKVSHSHHTAGCTDHLPGQIRSGPTVIKRFDSENVLKCKNQQLDFI